MTIHQEYDLPENEYERNKIINLSLTTTYYQLATGLQQESYMKILNLIKGIEANAAAIMMLPIVDPTNAELYEDCIRSIKERVNVLIDISKKLGETVKESKGAAH